jgi:hypothetical protein
LDKPLVMGFIEEFGLEGIVEPRCDINVVVLEV